jgi:hypothetical protein
MRGSMREIKKYATQPHVYGGIVEEAWSLSNPRLLTPSPGPRRLKKTPARATLSPKGERAGI